MADLSIRQDFLEGTQEIFLTLFNEGVVDGLDYYALDLENTSVNVYRESNRKRYKPPVRLICRANITPQQGEQDVKGINNSILLTVPYSCLLEREIGVSAEELEYMQKGLIMFHGVAYNIDIIDPKSYVEDTFLFYDFKCTQNREDINLIPVIEESENE